jgi:hypothetical protein
MIMPIFQSDISDKPQAVYRVETAKAGIVYMTVKSKLIGNENRAVVIVDSSKLIDLWRCVQSNDEALLANGNEAVWRRDKKFGNAEKVFSHGIKSPVWLANVVCKTETRRYPVYEKKYFFLEKYVGFSERDVTYISFNDGITRTIWLLANGARAFPIEVCIEDAELLASCVSSEKQYLTVAQIYESKY